ncbi:hypothetical protein [Massilia sp. NP310]|uniref:hypothetical protein n=1 Tax=Massilia sp. NP310 TaxID=2861282 RepID=UPI001C63A4AC|nr:hypothetical protein [Massilia sp. NP310]QYG03995.1 hypothetical protein KY496_11755 [Massilia sp. NP310]
MPVFLPWLLAKLSSISPAAWRALALAVAVVAAVGGFYHWAHGRGFDQGEAKANAAHAKVEAARVKAQAEADAARSKKQAEAEADQAKANAAFMARNQAAAKESANLRAKLAAQLAKRAPMPECDAPAEDKALLNEAIKAANARIGLANKQLSGAGE